MIGYALMKTILSLHEHEAKGRVSMVQSITKRKQKLKLTNKKKIRISSEPASGKQ